MAASTTSLRYLLGTMFLAVGIYKLMFTPSQIAINFYTMWSKVSPLAVLGFTINPLPFMNAISLLELAFGTSLLLGSITFQRVSCVVLSMVCLGVLHTLLVGKHFLMAGLPLVLILALVFVLLTADEGKKQKGD